MDIYQALKNDHRRLQHLLSELMNVSPGEAQSRHAIIARIRDELVPHTRAEEAVFYNPMRIVDESNTLVMHAYQEHLEAEAKLRYLQLRDKIDIEWKDAARELKTSIEHHIQDEEEKLFPVAKLLFTHEEAHQMAVAFASLKPQIKDENILQTSLEMLVNLMPVRFQPKSARVNLDARIES